MDKLEKKITWFSVFSLSDMYFWDTLLDLLKFINIVNRDDLDVNVDVDVSNNTSASISAFTSRR